MHLRQSRGDASHEADALGSSPGERGPGRLEAFSDGVIAVIITIMVLELHVPAGNAPRDLLTLWPTFMAYLVSFLFVAVYWVNHHQLIRSVGRVDFRVLWTNNLWLLALSFIPFFTEYLGAKHVNTFSVRLYALCMIAAAATFFLLRTQVARVRCSDGMTPEETPGATFKHAAAMAADVVAIAIAGRHPYVSLLLIALVGAAYIFPDTGLHRRVE